MGMYSRIIFPRLCDWTMRSPPFARLRKEVLASVDGEILEIGFGTGLNLAHYPGHVRRLTAIDPGAGMGRIARKRLGESTISVDHRVCAAEELPFDDQAFDMVITTWTLCSIPDLARALREIYRVLRPAARYVFLEHGLSDDTRVQKWQRRLNPIQRRIGDGCRLDLDVEAVIRSEPFREVTVNRFLLEKTPRTHGTMYRGFAMK
jgi:ubiquinone/menaquinone biosynthesis C-methylase UbiE